ncbi:hypothetical protein HK097_007365 [Rhizophlyctis rosea]|uniref:G-protein coupled receptors family 3 profile domain-containing protein n=1 Tax=Rhizophlyctis rosea TaxID=64517 RepID=A0AAD5X4M2_9FUNG|nr:hypothetical protein HK097_007365 [Rhizophlyctis rosea]
MLDTFMDAATLADPKTFAPGYWTKVTIPLEYFRALMTVATNDVNRVIIQNAALGEYYAAMWLGNLTDWISPEQMPHYVDPPFLGPLNETTFDEITESIEAKRYALLTDGQSDNAQWGGDKGIKPEWSCAGPVPRGYSDLTDVYIRAFRDTTLNISIPMDVLHNVAYDEIMGTITYRGMYGGTALSFNARNIPNPVLGCALHNADFFVIGNVNTATYVLKVWYPEMNSNLPHVIAGYARWVKSKRIGDRDDYAVKLRTRLPNKMRGGRGYKKTGFDPAIDMEASALTLVTYSGQQYALPAWVESTSWSVRKNVLTAAGLKLPPPQTEWGTAWWKRWNMDVFTSYLETLYTNHSLRGVFNLPGGSYAETELQAFSGMFYGDTLYNATGRCGYDSNTINAWKKTILYYLSRPGMLGPRIPSNQTYYEEWLKEPINWNNPQLQTGPTINHPGWGNPQWLPTAFDIQECSADDCVSIYAPTGPAKLSAALVGIPFVSREPNIAYEALMGAIVQNEDLQVNCPVGYRNRGGISAWTSTSFTSEYQNGGKSFWSKYISHGVFPGYPAAQTASHYHTSVYSPITVVTNELVWKSDQINASQAIDRVCKIVNYATRPPCTSKFWNTTVVVDPKTNRGTINFDWRDDIEYHCRTDIELAQEDRLPDPVVNYLPSTAISPESMTGKVVLALGGIGMIIEYIMMVAFIWKRNCPVIRAASLIPSLIIMFGAILTLMSMMIRVGHVESFGWNQCFGTYWTFSIGFSTTLGALAMKTYRIDAIFRSENIVKITDLQIVICILLIDVPNVIISLLYQVLIVDPSGIERTPFPAYGVVLAQQDCPKSSKWPKIAYYAYNALVVIFAAIIAYRTRNAVSSYNENTFTIAAISLITVIACIIVPVLQSKRFMSSALMLFVGRKLILHSPTSVIDSPEATFYLVALGTFSASVLSTVVFAIPKLLIAFNFIAGEDIQKSLEQRVGLRPNIRASTVDKESADFLGDVGGFHESITMTKDGESGRPSTSAEEVDKVEDGGGVGLEVGLRKGSGKGGSLG